jgi:CheY-like chemotaxis protein
MRRVRSLETTSPRAAASLHARIDRAIVDRAAWVPLVNPRQTDFVSSRLDGHAVARLVKERRPQVGVIVLTGSDSAEDRRRAEQAGVDAFVEKRHLAETQLSDLIASL